MSQSTHSILFNQSAESGQDDKIFHPTQAEQAEELERAESLYYKTFPLHGVSIFDEKYIFINTCMTLLYGILPEYSYYESNEYIHYFFENVQEDEIIKIYYYLLEGGYINPSIIIKNDFKNNFELYVNRFCEPVQDIDKYDDKYDDEYNDEYNDEYDY